MQSSTTTYFFHHCRTSRTTSTHHFGRDLPPADPGDGDPPSAILSSLTPSSRVPMNPGESGATSLGTILDDPLNRAKGRITADSIYRGRDSQNRSDYTRSASLGAPLSMVSEVAPVPWNQPGCLSSRVQLARRFIGSVFSPGSHGDGDAMPYDAANARRRAPSRSSEVATRRLAVDHTIHSAYRTPQRASHVQVPRFLSEFFESREECAELV